MNTKLTLRMENELIEKIKIYAMHRKLSLSKITENLYKELLEIKNDKKIRFSPITMKYKGILKEQDLNEREAISEYLIEKYK